MKSLKPCLLLLVIVSGVDLSSAAPSDDASGKSSGSTSFSTSSANGIEVRFSQVDVDGECVSNIKISGNGIYKKVKSACKGTGTPTVINLNKTLLVGDEYFTDTPAQLVHLKDGKCVRELFTREGDNYSSKEEAMDDAECEKVKLKIEVLKEEQQKWNEQAQQAQQQLQQELQQLQDRFNSFQHNLNGLFGNNGFFG